mmetsp:Transcript_5075/g.7662  ORF Transcript_5075/g.7662 Transcript_5075/m.7662 type:complete len:208 (+) Transcript_5075:1-624(+)
MQSSLIKMNWAALESDPEIFTDYFRSLGMSQDWEFGEVFTLEEDIPCSAVLLTYRTASEQPVFQGSPLEDSLFIKQPQELGNACGLLAGLHAVFNSDAEVQEQSLLYNLREGVRDKSPEEAAQWLINNQELNRRHQEFAQEGQSQGTEEPDYHYVAFAGGYLFDGMMQAPINLEVEGSGGFFGVLRQKLETGQITPDMSVMVLKRVD